MRMALGARPLDAAGAAVGFFGSWFAARVLQSLLFQVPARDPILLIAALLILFAVVFRAAGLPRGTRRPGRRPPLQITAACGGPSRKNA